MKTLKGDHIYLVYFSQYVSHIEKNLEQSSLLNDLLNDKNLDKIDMTFNIKAQNPY